MLLCSYRTASTTVHEAQKEEAKVPDKVHQENRMEQSVAKAVVNKRWRPGWLTVTYVTEHGVPNNMQYMDDQSRTMYMIWRDTFGR